MPDEVEGKLIIVAEDAEAVYEAVAASDSFVGCRVAHRQVEHIEDAYFDGPARPLFAVGLALRVRSLNGRELLTVKGEARLGDGVISREELEVDWSEGGLDEVLEALGQAGVSFGGVEAAREATTARGALEALGLTATSPRSNRRTALTLMRSGEVVAEVDVDAVTFRPGGRLVRYFEVECEARGSGDASVVRAVLTELRSRHAGLRAWNVSKLALGEVMEALEREGRLDEVLSGDHIRPDVYDLIEGLAAD